MRSRALRQHVPCRLPSRLAPPAARDVTRGAPARHQCPPDFRTSCPPPPTLRLQFIFLDASGKPVAAAVGRLPREVLAGNTKALAEGQPLPYARIQAAGASGLQRSDGAMAGPRQVAPLDHS